MCHLESYHCVKVYLESGSVKEVIGDLFMEIGIERPTESPLLYVARHSAISKTPYFSINLAPNFLFMIRAKDH
jgi:hypothetical protein